MNRIALLALLMYLPSGLWAQVDSTQSIKQGKDTLSSHSLHEVMIRAYGADAPLLLTPAAAHVIGETDLRQSDNTSILPAVNKTPGIRMEERSPGSYRFNIRGSALESPFGVRNIKVYYNDIPFTDPGGNTYLNQFGYYNFQSVELIKGPGSSLYGAGTGGVVLINSIPANWQPGATLNYTAGSYNLNSFETEVRTGDSGSRNIIRYQHVSSDGYRIQTATRNDIISWDAIIKYNAKIELSTHFFYGDLYYQTPGALTLLQYTDDPQQARPKAGATPGSVESSAAIYQKTFLAGFTVKQKIAASWVNSTTLYGDYSSQLNPNIRNYSRTSEPNFGGRSQFVYDHSLGSGEIRWITGIEAQQGIALDKTYENINGEPQNLQSDQEITNRMVMAFTQATLQMRKWVITGGAGINQLSVDLKSIGNTSYSDEQRIFSNQLAPRLAVLNRVTTQFSVYGIVEKGFSPPTTSELAPTGSNVNFSLGAEHAWNYEIGARTFIGNSLFIEAGIFYMMLHDAIVQRRDSTGGDYYLNAGSTHQAGLEIYISDKLYSGAGFISSVDLYLSYTGNYFHYDKFVQSGTDYSGKQMPGIAPNTIAAGISMNVRNGLYLNINHFFSDKIAMDDANTAYSTAYNLLNAKVGYNRELRRCTIGVFVGAKNILNEKYSLGNDINAISGRYYNAAPPTSYYAGISLGYLSHAAQ